MDQFGFNFAEKSELARWINEDYDARLDMLAAAVTAEGMEINSIGHDDTDGLIVNVIDNGAKGRFKQTLVIGETSFEVTFNRVSSRRRFKALVISKEDRQDLDRELAGKSREDLAHMLDYARLSSRFCSSRTWRIAAAIYRMDGKEEDAERCERSAAEASEVEDDARNRYFDLKPGSVVRIVWHDRDRIVSAYNPDRLEVSVEYAKGMRTYCLLTGQRLR